ncbi:MAG: hypothetical protein FWG67_08155 [Defluviitaleaceae bacterium]|nr:hypothetical protein [Defluviitaleaceae bacterium]
MSYVEALNERVMLELTEILLYCHTCEFQVLELLKVANCIFDKDEFFEVVDAYTTFKSNMEILENLLTQLDEPITMLQIVTVKSMLNQLKVDFDGLINILEDADTRIDYDKIDFDAAEILNELLDRLSFDVVDFESFEDAFSGRYFITYLMKPEDVGYNRRYGRLTVLKVERFKTKCAAYTYALKNGISKDMVWRTYS